MTHRVLRLCAGAGQVLICGFVAAVVLCAAFVDAQSNPPGVTDAKSDADAVKAVEEMIRAHGDLNQWRDVPTVYFEDEFKLAGAPAGMVSQVTVAQRSRQAYIDYPAMSASMAWDGQRAWSENWALPMPPRFMALLNYYFLNLMWLTMDPGVNLTDLGSARLWDDPTEYITVRMTFESGVGDTPDDYYVLYIHPETMELKANRYIVTYKALLPEGVEHSPEHVLVYDEFESVDGFKVPTHYTIYLQDHSLYAACAVRNWSFQKTFDASRMTKPDGAVLDPSGPQVR